MTKSEILERVKIIRMFGDKTPNGLGMVHTLNDESVVYAPSGTEYRKSGKLVARINYGAKKMTKSEELSRINAIMTYGIRSLRHDGSIAYTLGNEQVIFHPYTGEFEYLKDGEKIS